MMVREDLLDSPEDFIGGVSVQVNYASADSLWASQRIENPKYSVEILQARGPQGLIHLVTSGFPSGVNAIRVWTGGTYALPTNAPLFFDVPISSFSNGVYAIPD